MSSTQRVLGQVKWFNNKAGYGFITVSDGEQTDKEIFVHYSSIRVTNSQYKYLVQGEYVEFLIEKSTSEAHELHAVDISGVKGGKLMCETRRINVVSQEDRESSRPSYSREGRNGSTYRKYRIQRRPEGSQRDSQVEVGANA